MTPAAVPIRNPAVIRRPQEGGWSVLVNLDNARSVALNPTADLVWRTLDGRRDAAAIVAFMRGRFRDVPASATDDVTGLLEELAESGFVGYECGRGRPREAERVSPAPRQASGATQAVASPGSIHQCLGPGALHVKEDPPPLTDGARGQADTTDGGGT